MGRGRAKPAGLREDRTGTPGSGQPRESPTSEFQVTWPSYQLRFLYVIPNWYLYCISGLPPGQDRGTQMTVKGRQTRRSSRDALPLCAPIHLHTHARTPGTAGSKDKTPPSQLLTILTRKMRFRAKRNLPSTIQTGRTTSADTQPKVQLLGKLFPSDHLPHHHCPEQDWFFLVH